MGNHVFVCYAREDEAFVLKLATNLKSLGVPIWLDQWDIPSGADWDLTIDNALYDCAQFLIVLSKTSVESLEVRSELRTVLDEKKPIVPIFHQLCRIPRQLRLIQRADFTSCSPDDIIALNQVLKALGMGEAAPKEPEETEILAQKEKIKSPINQTIGAEDAKNWYNKGRDLYFEGNFDEAVKCYDKAIELDPKFEIAISNKKLALGRL